MTLSCLKSSGGSPFVKYENEELIRIPPFRHLNIYEVPRLHTFIQEVTLEGKKNVTPSPLGVGTTRLKLLAALCSPESLSFLLPPSSEQFHFMFPGIIL